MLYYVSELYFLNHCIYCAYGSFTDCRQAPYCTQRYGSLRPGHKRQLTAPAGTRFPERSRVSGQYESVLRLPMIDLGRTDLHMRQLANRTKWFIIRWSIVGQSISVIDQKRERSMWFESLRKFSRRLVLCWHLKTGKGQWRRR